LVDGLIELTVDRRLLTQDSVAHNYRERVLIRQQICFMPCTHVKRPVFLSDLLNQNFLQRAHRFQILLQAGQQTSELFLVLAGNRGKLLGE
jgi:hypothetical protein